MAEGERAPFQIREFPVALREEIVKEAKANDLSVGEFMVAVCTAAREAGWIRARPAKAAANGVSNGQTTTGEASAIATLIEAACRLAGTKGVNRSVRSHGNKAIERQLAGYARALPAPEEKPEELG